MSGFFIVIPTNEAQLPIQLQFPNKEAVSVIDASLDFKNIVTFSTLVSNVVVSTVSFPSDATPLVVTPTTMSGTVAHFQISEGQDSASYNCSFTCSFNDSEVMVVQVGLNCGPITTNGQYEQVLFGDVTGFGPPHQTMIYTTLATVNANAGTFVSANITVNAQGLITAASSGSSGGGSGLPDWLIANSSGTYGSYSFTLETPSTAQLILDTPLVPPWYFMGSSMPSSQHPRQIIGSSSGTSLWVLTLGDTDNDFVLFNGDGGTNVLFAAHSNGIITTGNCPSFPDNSIALATTNFVSAAMAAASLPAGLVFTTSGNEYSLQIAAPNLAGFAGGYIAGPPIAASLILDAAPAHNGTGGIGFSGQYSGDPTPTRYIAGQVFGSNRWIVDLGTSDEELGNNSGSLFTVSAYDDSGNYLDTVLTIHRDTSIAAFSNTVQTITQPDADASSNVATTQFVMNAISLSGGGGGGATVAEFAPAGNFIGDASVNIPPGLTDVLLSPTNAYNNFYINLPTPSDPSVASVLRIYGGSDMPSIYWTGNNNVASVPPANGGLPPDLFAGYMIILVWSPSQSIWIQMINGIMPNND